jgi:hypothetical protein
MLNDAEEDGDDVFLDVGSESILEKSPQVQNPGGKFRVVIVGTIY